MLTLHDSRFPRRRFLSVGGLAAGCALGGFSLGGLSLADLLAAEAAVKRDAVKGDGVKSRSDASRVDATKSGLLTGKSVIFIFQQGGPSQYETFDPKPAAPSEIRTVTGVTQTSLPGVLFGDTFERLAPLAHKLAIVRSFATGNAGHNIRPIVGPESGNTNLGSLYSRVAGATHPVTAMPTNAVLFPQSVANDVTNGNGRGDLASTGTVGAAYAPFIPGGTGQLVKNLRLGMHADRFQDRESLRSQFDQLQRRFEAESGSGNDSPFKSFDRNQQQACEVLLSGRVADALDLSKEDPELVRRYDTSRFAARDNWKRAQRGVRGYYTGHAKSFGKALLLARRLCEAGCGFVTVHCDYEGVWDMHADGNNLNMRDGMQAVGRSFDHAVAEFIDDVETRGLSDRILLVATGEMGRTPRINRNGGRDHWAKLAPLMMYGGGAAQGKVIGQSTRDGGEPATDPQTTENLISTLLHATLDTAQLRLKPGLGAIAKLAEPAPFPGLF